MRGSFPSPVAARKAVVEVFEERRLLSADLAGLFASASPSELDAGMKNHVAIRVVNQGDARAAGSVTIDLFASTDSTAGDDVLLATMDRNIKLKPGRGTTVKLQFASPPALAAGTYSLVAQIDPGVIPDAIAANNIVVAPTRMTVAAAVADVSVQSVTAPTRAIFNDGEKVSSAPVSVRVVNGGTAAAGGTLAVNFYLSTDKVLDQGDVLVGSIPGRAVVLQPGHGQVLRGRIQPPLDVPGGWYYLFAVVTPGGGIVLNNSANGVGLARRQVLILRGKLPVHEQSDYETDDICYDGIQIDCTDIATEDEGTEEPPAEKPPATQPGDTQPTSQPSASPTTYPATQPVETDPTTQPSTDPTDSGDSSSDSSSQDSSSGDSSGGSSDDSDN